MDATAAALALLTDEGRADPYPFYDIMRAHAPTPGIVADYAEAARILRDPTLRVKDWSTLDGDERAQPAHEWLTRTMLRTNPPDHERLRQLVSGAFTPRRVLALRADIERLAGWLADGLTDDFMESFAYPLPILVICALLGVPESDHARFRPLVSDLTLVLERPVDDEAAMSRANTAALELREYLVDLVAARRATPGDDLVTAVLATDRLSTEELLANLGLLLFAGFETTTNLLGNGLVALLDRPAIADRLRAGAPAAPFVEEMLRFDAPIQVTSRFDPDGAEIIVFLGAANRDPARFPRPAVFDPDRPANQSLSFGAGAHFCFGAALARLEAQVAFPLLLRRYPGLAAAGEPVRRDSFVFRGYARLPISTGP